VFGFAYSPAPYENRTRVLVVNKTLTHVKDIAKDGTYKYKYLLQPPKTKSSNRTVPIPTILIPTLKLYIAKQKEKILKNGLSYSQDKLLFTTETCECFNSANFLKAWRRVLKKAGIEYRNVRNIRHTYATTLFEKNAPLKTVSTLLGHSSIKITADTYIHVMPRKKIKASELLNDMFG